ncbi:MAG: AtpZ/AtpI family protein [Alphaproteobacteria bacterium]|nr:AtpZ/AtpI family protein [Alphaproteobacteria bacterium]
MPNRSDEDKLDEQAARIYHAEEEAGIKPHEPDPETVTFRTTARGYRVGTDFVVTVLTFIALGWLLDRGLGWEPWGLLILMLVGFGVGLMNLWRAIKKEPDGGPDGPAKKED